MAEFALTSADERSVLNFDPWGERDATYRVLRSGFGVCRKPHECAICFGRIAPGDRIWARAETDDGMIKTFHFCPECCWCIAHRLDESQDDDSDADAPWMRMEGRYDLGRTRAEQQRAG